MVGGAKTENGLALHLHVAAEHREGYLDCGGPPGGARGPSPTPGHPSPGFQYQEEKSPQNLAVKSNGDSD